MGAPQTPTLAELEATLARLSARQAKANSRVSGPVPEDAGIANMRRWVEQRREDEVYLQERARQAAEQQAAREANRAAQVTRMHYQAPAQARARIGDGPEDERFTLPAALQLLGLASPALRYRMLHRLKYCEAHGDHAWKSVAAWFPRCARDGNEVYTTRTWLLAYLAAKERRIAAQERVVKTKATRVPGQSLQCATCTAVLGWVPHRRTVRVYCVTCGAKECAKRVKD